MAWFDDLKTPRVQKQDTTSKTSRVPEGAWSKCNECGEIQHSRILSSNFNVCPICQAHGRLTAWERIKLMTDEGASDFKEYGASLISKDPLEFDDTVPYRVRLEKSIGRFNQNDAIIAGKAKINKIPYHLAVFDFQFMGGSMGVVVGEKVAMTMAGALKDQIPAVIVCASGGARMQEGVYSLLQMAKTSSLVSQLKKKGIPMITLLTNPTTGGVAASFAMQADVILAEPKALIGFAGPRVIEQTIRQKLPEGFQRSEFLLIHGFVDRIVHRKNLKKELSDLLWRLGMRTCRFGK
ncbi:MAG: acetyl-CoA carboxylase carboxyltransferase subunit beta [Xanthomonadaceae bacterium]|nr:acetyl-CoA carboxylase carboxyltransferase subunit beta [Xanthomonadaceae bacterium]